jgi:hypothetical protein
MTAQYSNAVLVAALPYVSDFVGRASLPIKEPIVTNDVARTDIVPYKGHSDVGVWLTNKYWFWVSYSGGFVGSFRAPNDFFAEQEADITKYAGQDHMTTNDAIAMARDVLIMLGYQTELTHLYEIPALGPVNTN